MLGIPLFRELKPQQLKKLALSAERIVFQDGDELITQGQTGNAAYLIVHGEVEVIVGTAAGRQRQPLTGGTLIGEMAMLVETIHHSTVVARGRVRTLTFCRRTMLELMTTDSELAAHFAEHVRSRLNKLSIALNIVNQQIANDTSIAEEYGASTLTVCS